MNAVMTDEITLSAEQQHIFELMENGSQHLFVTGKAGTGKSVLLRYFRGNTRKKVAVCAPTGIAALNVRGQTIHSLFRLAPGFMQKGSLRPNQRVCSVLKRIETIIIDEISMVRADLMDAIDERLREAHKNTLPFGGMQVIMFGDPYQLPPVVEEGLLPYFEHIYGGYHFFRASAWTQTEFKIYELSQIFRQKDPVFKDILNVVRDGSVTDEQIQQLNERHNIPIPPEGVLTLASTNALVTNINQRRLDQLEGKAHEYKAVITGEMKRSTFPTEEVIQLKVGAQVVLLQNDKDKRWVNGTVATISELKDDMITVHVDGIDYDMETTTWEEIRYEYDILEGKVKEEVVSSFTQYPVRLAWAMTIHKSQGQTYESVALDLTTDTFAPGQLYVALSRCTSLEGLYLKIPVKRGHVLVDAKVKDFMTKRESIIIEVPAIESETVVEALPIQQDLFSSEDGNFRQMKGDLQGERDLEGSTFIPVEEDTPVVARQDNPKPAKKVGHPKGKTKVGIPLTIDITMQQFLDSLLETNRSKYVNNLLIQQSQLDALSSKYYNYVLMRPDGSVFYVGKGQGDRINQHEREAKRGVDSYKCRVIRKIWEEGGQVIKQIVAYHDNEEDAFEFEILLISFFGRENLMNCTDGGEGASGGLGGRPRKDLVGVQVKLTLEQIERTKDIDRSELIRKLLDEYFAKEEAI